MRIAFVSRELHPLCGGGIGVQIAGACAALVDVAEVTVVTSSALEPAYRRLQAVGGDEIPAGVRVAFVDDPRPDEVGTYFGLPHLYSARVWEKLRDLYPDGGPDLIEFSDFMAEGVVTVQARRAHDPLLRDTGICVRLHTSAEICSILDGHIGDDFDTRMVVSGERHLLRHADRLLAPAAAVLETYEQFYRRRAEAADGPAAKALAPSTVIPPIVPPDAVAPVAPPPIDELRLLYVGRLERRKGVQDLVRALTGLRRDDWRLTLVGGDTDTGPLATSMRDVLGLAVAGDPRIAFHDELPRARLRELIDEHHVIVAPSRWECWPSAVLEALGRNRPVLATPTGGMPEMLAGEGAGWVTSGVGDMPLAKAIEALLDSRQAVTEAIEGGGPRRAYDRLNDPERLRSAYTELAASFRDQAGRRPARAVSDEPPLVSVVIPYYQLDRFIEDAVRSIFEQDYPAIDAIVVNDGSFRVEDVILGDLAERFPIRILTQENSGLGRARNLGIICSRGRYVVPLDADNMLDPTFVSRGVELLEREPEIAFVTSWARYVDEGGLPLDGVEQGIQPIGNSGTAVLENNLAGDATAVFRREVFDAGHSYSPYLSSYEDWQLYRALHRDGIFGLAIPERLFTYRVRGDSLSHTVASVNHDRLYGEMQAELRSAEIEWLCTGAPDRDAGQVVPRPS